MEKRTLEAALAMLDKQHSYIEFDDKGDPAESEDNLTLFHVYFGLKSMLDTIVSENFTNVKRVEWDYQEKKHTVITLGTDAFNELHRKLNMS